MDADQLGSLKLPPEQKRRPTGSLWTIFLAISAATLLALFVAWPRASDGVRIFVREGAAPRAPSTQVASTLSTPVADTAKGDVLLTVSGYIINGTRIELSPRFMGVVTWVGVDKGDAVTNGQVLVKLDDTEYRARLRELEGRKAGARAALRQAELAFERVSRLARTDIESEQAVDDATLRLDSARAALIELDGIQQLAQAYVDWCVIRSPMDGIILERLVDPNELVTPQSFGGPRGPSTGLVALADPKDIQIEVDLNESDLAKVRPGQRCRVAPEAYPDRTYAGYVREIAPEANRSKGTLQIKVQVEGPDSYLTPELSARVDFLR